MSRPTIDQIRRAINYDPVNGTFSWTYDESVYINYRGKPTGLTGPRGHKKIVYHGIQLKAHHVAWAIYYGEWPIELDHEDNDRGNNRIKNLRKATRQANQMNRIISKNNTSGFKGVTGRKHGGFEAKIVVQKKYIHIGKYRTAKEAAMAYDVAALQHHGAFAKTNKMLGLLP
jgi:hypothetical protein